MPADYKYQFMPDERMKALKMAYSRYSDLRKQLSKSGVIAPSILEEMRVIGVLLTRAESGSAGDIEDMKLLDKLLGSKMAEQFQ
jgi:hypothetical protein